MKQQPESRLVGKRKFLFAHVCLAAIIGLLCAGKLTGKEFIDGLFWIIAGYMAGSGLEYFSGFASKLKAKVGIDTPEKPEAK